MDEVCLRFPHICVMIFDTLDDQTLVKCRLVSKHWKSCIDAEKFLWSRIIQKYIGRPNLKRSLYVNNPNSKRSRTEPRNIVQRLGDLSPEGNFWKKIVDSYLKIGGWYVMNQLFNYLKKAKNNDILSTVLKCSLPLIVSFSAWVSD